MFAGETRVIDGRTYAIAHCPQCRVDIPFWTAELEASGGADPNTSCD